VGVPLKGVAKEADLGDVAGEVAEEFGLGGVGAEHVEKKSDALRGRCGGRKCPVLGGKGSKIEGVELEGFIEHAVGLVLAAFVGQKVDATNGGDGTDFLGQAVDRKEALEVAELLVKRLHLIDMQADDLDLGDLVVGAELAEAAKSVESAGGVAQLEHGVGQKTQVARFGGIAAVCAFEKSGGVAPVGIGGKLLRAKGELGEVAKTKAQGHIGGRGGFGGGGAERTDKRAEEGEGRHGGERTEACSGHAVSSFFWTRWAKATGR
jgi:hypothetical protein